VTVERAYEVFDLLAEAMQARDESWRAEAACAGMGVDLFFPAHNSPKSYAAAKRVCAGCSVVSECRTSWRKAPSQQRLHGVWWGADYKDRKRLKDT
jgi:WhiB family redox-sensing transcriptional regulator